MSAICVTIFLFTAYMATMSTGGGGSKATDPAVIQKFKKDCERRNAGCLIVWGNEVHVAESNGGDYRIRFFTPGRHEKLINDKTHFESRVVNMRFIFPDNPDYKLFLEHYAKGGVPGK